MKSVNLLQDLRLEMKTAPLRHAKLPRSPRRPGPAAAAALLQRVAPTSPAISVSRPSSSGVTTPRSRPVWDVSFRHVHTILKCN